MTNASETATAIAEAVRAGRQSARSVAEQTLDHADAYDAIQPQIWIARFPREDVQQRARGIDARLGAGESLPLAGVPFAIKDNIDIAGVPTTAACPAFAYTPGRDAAVVERLLAAGAIPIGKTNLDQFATGLVGSRSPYGACGCVFNREYISGGSSSGSAIAVAAGIVPFALGTDTAGSGRVPAAFNGLFGFKPTRGSWSTRGVLPACRSLDCVSVFTADAADARLIDGVLAAFDNEDPYSRANPKPSWKIARIGIPRAGQVQWCGDAQSAALFEHAKGHAATLGVTLIEVDIAPLLECARLLYQGPWVAERLGVIANLLRENPGAIHPIIRGVVQAGESMSAVQAFEGFHALKRYERDTQELWKAVDALLLPTTPTIYRIAEVLAEPFGLNGNLGPFTNFVNLLDMAAINIPAGFRDNGTGFGVSIIGPAWSDGALMDMAARFHNSAAPLPTPDTKPRAPTVKLAVVGAHLSGMPLNWQLASRGARLVRTCKTAPTYRLYAMANSAPPKPTLVHVPRNGAAIEVEVYELGLAEFGSFTAEVPAPLAIGTIMLDDGETVKGFVSEPRATDDAQDITHLGGWRAFVAGTRKP